jgi:phosphoglycerate dehydrogenase-like enzyme
MSQHRPSTPAAAGLVFSLALCFGAAVRASDLPTSPSAPALSDSLGLQAAPHPVRERPGWRPPRIVLVNDQLRDELTSLQAVAPRVKLVLVSAATPRDIAGADATIGVCTPEVLTQAKQLRWIQWTAAGVERCVQQPAVRARGVLLTNTQRIAGPSMAEHVLMLMLALSHNLPYFEREQQKGHWVRWDDAPPAADLDGKTLLVVGLGGIGSEVARRAHALGMRVIATRASGRNGPDYVSYVGLPDELLKLTAEADFVVNCAPLTPETTGIFNREFFAAMKHSAYFVSVGRGRSAVTTDLVAALRDGTIAGAGLDVVDPEPLPPDSPLWALPNVIITPHVSAKTPVSREQFAALLRENLRRYVAGEPMLAVVDIERGY